MYQIPPDHHDLRQGDILSDFYFPIYDFRQLEFMVSAPVGEGDPVLLTNRQGRIRGVLYFQSSHVMVVSQCCDLIEDRRDYISVACIREVRPDFYHETEAARGRLEALRRSNEIVVDGSRNNDYVQFFYLQPHEGGNEWVVDLSTITSFKLRDRAAFLAKKTMQLSDRARYDLKTKIAYFFSRPDTAVIPCND